MVSMAILEVLVFKGRKAKPGFPRRPRVTKAIREHQDFSVPKAIKVFQAGKSRFSTKFLLIVIITM